MKEIQMNQLLIDIGGGIHPKDGYKNLDITDNADIKYNISENNYKLPFNNNEVDKIHMSHIIEHFSFSNSLKLLNDCYRCLKSNGTIEIHTIDIIKIYNDYIINKNIDDFDKRHFKRFNGPLKHIHLANFHIFHADISPWQDHKSLWTQDYLVDTLSYVGFQNIQTDIKSPIHREKVNVGVIGVKR